MARGCAVRNCGKIRGRSYHTLPLNEPVRLKLWLEFLELDADTPLEVLRRADHRVCALHFTEEDFAKGRNKSPKKKLRLKQSAVPTLYPGTIKLEELGDSVETSEVGCDPKPSDNFDLETEAADPSMRGKVFVYEKCLLQLFPRKCLTCRAKLQMEKVTYGILIVINQKCLQCGFKNQWKSQVDAEINPESRQASLTDGSSSCEVKSEIIDPSDEDDNPSDDGEEADHKRPKNSDDEWELMEDYSLEQELLKVSDEDSDEDSGEEEDSELKTKELCTDCGCFFNVAKPHVCEYKIKPYSCNICGKRCVNRKALKAHSNIHKDTYDYPCRYCYAIFRTRADKLKHEEIHQGDVKPYKCSECSEKFTSSKNRKTHVHLKHGKKEITCPVCGFSCRGKDALQRHSMVHTGEKPYRCSVCDRGFNQSGHLKSHMRMHTGEKPYGCRLCEQRFNHNVSLKNHVQRYHATATAGKELEGREKEGEDDDGTEEEPEEVKKTAKYTRQRATGRPKGRPKRAKKAETTDSEEAEEERRKTVKTKPDSDSDFSPE